MELQSVAWCVDNADDQNACASNCCNSSVFSLQLSLGLVDL